MPVGRERHQRELALLARQKPGPRRQPAGQPPPVVEVERRARAAHRALAVPLPGREPERGVAAEESAARPPAMAMRPMARKPRRKILVRMMAMKPLLRMRVVTQTRKLSLLTWRERMKIMTLTVRPKRTAKKTNLMNRGTMRPKRQSLVA